MATVLVADWPFAIAAAAAVGWGTPSAAVVVEGEATEMRTRPSLLAAVSARRRAVNVWKEATEACFAAERREARKGSELSSFVVSRRMDGRVDGEGGGGC